MRHISHLSLCLIIATLCFALCAFALTTKLASIAVPIGMALFLALACAFFYATLHLQKVR